mgnify:CR=1 FL=1
MSDPKPTTAPSSNKSNTSIFYFGFYGLELTDEASDIWLFGDAGIVPKSSAPQEGVASALIRTYHLHPAILEKWGNKFTEAINDFSNVPVNSYIVVKNRTTSDDSNPVSGENKARIRAKEISSLLGCVLYFSPEGPFAAGLEGEILHWYTKSFEVGEDKSICHLGQAGPPEPLQDRTAYALSNNELRKKLYSQEFDQLTRIFDGREKISSSNLAKVVRASCNRVAEAIRSTSYTGELLSAYTAVDMLLDTASKDHYERRLSMLIGEDEALAYRASEVAKARNAIMHRGEGTDNIRALQAIALALDAVINAAAMAKEIGNSSELQTLLDIQILRRRLNSVLNDPVHPAELISKINLKTPYFRNKY